MEAAALSAALAIIRDRIVMQEVEGLSQLCSGLLELLARLEAHNCSLEVGKDVIQLAHEIEDRIESYVRTREGVAGKACGSLWMFFQWRWLRDDLSVLQKRINKVKVRMDSLHAFGPADKRLAAAELGTKKSNISANLHDVVGIEEDVKILSERLVGGEDNLSVITIIGMAGIGKTTLARKLLGCAPVERHFELRTWAHVGVDFQARGVLESVLSNVCSEWIREKIEEMQTMELIERIYKAYQGRRYLVVLDDMWSSEGWETIRFAFPDDENGSRVIITSRLKDVAPRSSNYIYEMRSRNPHESWELMKRRLRHHNLDVEAEKILMQISTHCGVPLVITLLSAQLQFKKSEDWIALLQHLEPLTQHLDQNTSDILDLIYNLLPVYLKPCFLYLGHFPPGYAIPVEKLYLLWIAEGLISTKGEPNVSKFGTAGDYFKALVDRRMVTIQEEEVSDTGRSKSCRFHDLLRDFCLYKGMNQEFLSVVEFGHVNNKPFVSSHRLAVYLNMSESADAGSLQIAEAKSVRSLLFFEKHGARTKPDSGWKVEVADLKEFRWARVLDFYGVDFRVRQLPRNIKRLVYLRYLSFRDCYLLEFPSSFSILSFLETLDLLVRESCTITVSNVLWKFKRLRYLYLPVVFQTDHSKGQDHKLKLDGLTELEILQNFHAGLCDVNDLLNFDKIKNFTGVVDGNNDDLEKIVKCLKYWKVTSSAQSSLGVKNYDCYSEKRWSIVKDLLTHYTALCVLEIEGRLPQLPSYTEINPNFTEMVFSGSEFEQDPVQILGKLPKLRSLVLSNNAFAGHEIVCGKEHFPQLKILKLAMLQRFSIWRVKAGAMPKLEVLTIEQCKSLGRFPHELMGIPTLQELKIGSMPPRFQQSVHIMAHKLRVHAKVRVYA